VSTQARRRRATVIRWAVGGRNVITGPTPVLLAQGLMRHDSTMKGDAPPWAAAGMSVLKMQTKKNRKKARACKCWHLQLLLGLERALLLHGADLLVDVRLRLAFGHNPPVGGNGLVLLLLLLVFLLLLLLLLVVVVGWRASSAVGDFIAVPMRCHGSHKANNWGFNEWRCCGSIREMPSAQD